MPDPTPPTPDLSDRLDALGRSLASRESSEPPAVIVAAVRARRARVVIARIGIVTAVAASVVLGTLAYFMFRPAAPNTPGPIVVNPAPSNNPSILRDRQAPSLATLRRLNSDAAPESLLLPTSASGGGSATTPSPSPTTRASDARDPAAIARVLGVER